MAIIINSFRQKIPNGVALITVLLIVALATTAAVAMASRQHVDLRRTENTLVEGQAQQFLHTAELIAQRVLYDDIKKNQVDHLGEDWARQGPENTFKIEEDGELLGSVSGYLYDLQGRFNLNNLHPDNDPNQLEITRFIRLLDNVGINNDQLAYTIRDWIDQDNNPNLTGGGAEDTVYLSQNPPYHTANRPMVSVSELLLLSGMTSENYRKLAPHVTALPQATKINVNTASAEVLACLDASLTVNQTKSIATDDRKFESIADFKNSQPFAGLNIDTAGLGVDSTYFLFQVEVYWGHLVLNTLSIFSRDNQGMIKTIARSEGEL